MNGYDPARQARYAAALRIYSTRSEVLAARPLRACADRTVEAVKVKEKWGNLTDDDLDKIAGRRDQLEGKIQERYGIAKDQAKKDIDTWYNTQTW